MLVTSLPSIFYWRGSVHVVIALHQSSSLDAKIEEWSVRKCSQAVWKYRQQIFSHNSARHIWRFCICQYGAQCSQQHNLESPRRARVVLRLFLHCRCRRPVCHYFEFFVLTILSIICFRWAFCRIRPVGNLSLFRLLALSFFSQTVFGVGVKVRWLIQRVVDMPSSSLTNWLGEAATTLNVPPLRDKAYCMPPPSAFLHQSVSLVGDQCRCTV